VIDVIKLHGIKFETITKPMTIEVESHRLTEPKWAIMSFENRLTLTAKQTPVKESRTYAAGSILIPMAQAAANVAIHLLEPNGPDSFVYWGFFNSIFEQKEYGEGYTIEKAALEMIRKDPELKREFDEKLKDPEFAKNPRARLNFFYERSPYYLNQKVGIYPVGRITSQYHLR
jgi:hypothetical protein